MEFAKLFDIGQTGAKIWLMGQYTERAVAGRPVVINHIQIDIPEPAIDLEELIDSYLSSNGLDSAAPGLVYTFAFAGARDDEDFCRELMLDHVGAMAQDLVDDVETELGADMSDNSDCVETGANSYGVTLIFREHKLAPFAGVVRDYVANARLEEFATNPTK